MKELPDPDKRAVYLNAIENIATDDFILKLNEISMHAFNSIYNVTLVDPMGKFIERIGRCEVSNNNELREKGGYIVEENSPNEENKKAIRDNLKIKTAKRDNIYLSGITLGENEKISIKYLIKVDTDAKDYSENKSYYTNGRKFLKLQNGCEVEYNIPIVRNIKKTESEIKLYNVLNNDKLTED